MQPGPRPATKITRDLSSQGGLAGATLPEKRMTKGPSGFTAFYGDAWLLPGPEHTWNRQWQEPELLPEPLPLPHRIALRDSEFRAAEQKQAQEHKTAVSVPPDVPAASQALTKCDSFRGSPRHPQPHRPVWQFCPPWREGTEESWGGACLSRNQEKEGEAASGSMLF